ncbi:MAG: hypothetical protein ACM3SY_03460 [Candidatus Omnitrophota bacterium]
MKKHYISIVMVVIFLSLFPSLLRPQQADIRKLNWGMPFDQVQRIENLKGEFYKDEELFGTKVEVLFGCDMKGLYSVTYSTQEKFFADQANKMLQKKYGAPKTSLDYGFLLRSKDILKSYPDTVIPVFEKGTFFKLNENPEIPMEEKKVIRVGLTKRSIWEYGNTVVLLLNSVDGAVLSYYSKPYYEESKKNFTDFMTELKRKVSIAPPKKQTDDGEKF